MNEIWVKQLILGNKQWSNVPTIRKADIQIILQKKIEKSEITEEQYNSIIGDTADT